MNNPIFNIKIILAPLLLFLLACNNPPAETETNTAAPDYTVDSTQKWTRNIKPSEGRDTINFTGANGQKQGHWIIFENGKKVKEEWYKDGKLIDKPESN